MRQQLKKLSEWAMTLIKKKIVRFYEQLMGDHLKPKEDDPRARNYHCCQDCSHLDSKTRQISFAEIVEGCHQLDYHTVIQPRSEQVSPGIEHSWAQKSAELTVIKNS
ncbi:hypothetical protein KIN20_024734 [Parelaphostrongylus tenuis]|uniref:Uncharacterized protein n=1 Tax=Parelaphostrongylus tenuis TaxID=148309 RepID=A0AAD5MTY0_PARTN|nr:hypothetical protein KIN20_024734 [Parelaphostrongylus tenuis]